ncbi:10509_t:CDS:2, partial [Gigaspora rosea]
MAELKTAKLNDSGAIRSNLKEKILPQMFSLFEHRLDDIEDRVKKEISTSSSLLVLGIFTPKTLQL